MVYLLMRAILTAVAVAGLVLASPRCCLAQAAPDPTPELTKIRELGDKMIAHRERLKSGVVRVTGVKSLTDPLRSVTQKLTIYHAFPSGLFVFDYREEIDPRWKDDRLVNESSEHRSVSARSPENSMQFCNLRGVPILFLDRPTQEPREVHPYEVRSFDIRSIGLYGGSRLFASDPLESRVKGLVTSPVEVSSASLYGDPLIAVVMRFADDKSYRRFWVNGDKGFTIFKTEFGYQHRLEETGDFGPPRRTAGCQAKWDLIEGVYVPVSYEAEWTRPFRPTDKERKKGVPEEGDSVREITLTFD